MSSTDTAGETAASGTQPDQSMLGGVVPFVMLRDAADAAAYYQRAFGAVEVNRVADESGKRLMHCHLRINGGSFVINDAFPEHGHALQTPQAFTMHLQVDDVDAWWNRVLAAGAEIVMPLEEQFWGDRFGIVRDPFGVTWSMSTPKA